MPRFPSGVVSLFELASEFQGEQHSRMFSNSDFLFAAVLNAVPIILFLVIAWRAMRAHERLADAASDWMDRQRRRND